MDPLTFSVAEGYSFTVVRSYHQTLSRNLEAFRPLEDAIKNRESEAKETSLQSKNESEDGTLWQYDLGGMKEELSESPFSLVWMDAYFLSTLALFEYLPQIKVQDGISNRCINPVYYSFCLPFSPVTEKQWHSSSEILVNVSRFPDIGQRNSFVFSKIGHKHAILQPCV